MRNLLLSAGLVCLLSGCSGGGGEVTGKVTLDDGSAAPRGVVTLSNDAGSFQGAIENGTYKIENVPSGDYTVSVAGVMDSEEDADAGMAFDDETGEYTDAEVSEPKSLIKESYGDLENSGLKITVPGDYDLTLDRADGAGAEGEGEGS